MKILLNKTYKSLIPVGLWCLVIYLLVCLIIPPLIGTQKKSKEHSKIPTPTTERVCLIDSNEEALNWRLRLINLAQSEIILSTLDFRADNSGSDVIAALMDAAERDVQVRLIIDGFSAQLHLKNNSTFQALAANENIEVKFYNPIRLTRLWTANYRCHDKYIIIDRSAYLIGGRNTSDLFLGNGGKTRQNIDRDVVVYGNGSSEGSVSTLLNYFSDIWSLDTNYEFRVNGEKKKVKDAASALCERWNRIMDAGQITPIDWERETILANGVSVLSGDCTPWNKAPTLMNTLAALMQKGETDTVLQTPYMICNRAMYDALREAFSQTEQVQIITNAPQSGANPWGCADYLNQRDNILATGASVCEWNGDHSMHTKTIIIDDHTSIIGSFNWDMRSAYLDTEMMLLVDCPELNAALREEADEMIRQGKLVSADGTTAEGEEYIAPEVSPIKNVVQALLRVVILPFRYVL